MGVLKLEGMNYKAQIELPNKNIGIIKSSKSKRSTQTIKQTNNITVVSICAKDIAALKASVKSAMREIYTIDSAARAVHKLKTSKDQNKKQGI